MIQFAARRTLYQMVNMKEQLTELSRGAEEILPDGGLEEKLKQNRPLNIKVGFDPTAPDLHVGHTVVITKCVSFRSTGTMLCS